MLQTEYEFTLPLGYVDEHGDVHREGVMRLAQARDQIEPLSDSRVRANGAYVAVLMLSRVVTELGKYAPVPPSRIEGLFAADFAFLQQMYLRINADPTATVAQQEEWIETECPECGARFELALSEEDGELES